MTKSYFSNHELIRNQSCSICTTQDNQTTNLSTSLPPFQETQSKIQTGITNDNSIGIWVWIVLISVISVLFFFRKSSFGFLR